MRDSQSGQRSSYIFVMHINSGDTARWIVAMKGYLGNLPPTREAIKFRRTLPPLQELVPQ